MISSVSNTSSMVSQLFAKLDTKSQGYLELSDLQSAYSAISGSDTSSASEVFSALDGDSDGKVTESEFSSTLSKLQESLDGQFNQMRMQGMGGHGPQGMAGMPPPPPPQNDSGFTQDELQSQLDEISSSDSKRSDFISNVVNNFSAADTDGDGKVTFQEARAFNESSQQSSSSSSTSSTSTSASTSSDSSSGSIGDQLAALIAGLGGMQPPPPPQNDSGFTEDELKSQLEAIGSSDSQRASLISNIVSNFAAADSDGDGKVTGQEARAYDESTKSSATASASGSTSTANNDDLKLMQQILQLVHAYGNNGASSSASSTLATSA